MTSSECGPAGRQILIWLVRGGVGTGLLVLAVSSPEPLVIAPAILAALFVFGGCPMCWILGLVERMSKVRQRSRT